MKKNKKKGKEQRVRLGQLAWREGLSVAERRRVLDEHASLNWDGLAAAAGMTRNQLEQLEPLSSLRGTFRTPYRLLAAVHGFGHEGGPARSLGQVLRRLGFRVSSAGTIDAGNYRRAVIAADFFGIALPCQGKRGPRVGHSEPADVETFTAAWEKANTNIELTTMLGQENNGATNARNQERAAELGLPDKLSVAARAARAARAAQERAARAAQERADRVAADAGKYPLAPRHVRRRAQGLRLSRERAAARAAARTLGCRHCGATLTAVTATRQREGWSKYCGDTCRHLFTEARRQQENAARRADAVQGSCEHCLTDIEPGPRAKRFCSKSCSKKAAYAARRTLA